MAQWSFVTQSRNGSQIADIGTELQNRRLLFQLGQPGVISGVLRATSARASRDANGGLQTGVHELKVYRDGEVLETVFALTKTDVAGSVDTVSLSLEWQGISSYFQDALVFPQTTEYSGTQLPWDWIDTFQTRSGGDYGITQGTVTGTPPTRIKTIQSETSIFESIHSLATSGAGFDWRINQNREYQEWHSQRGADNGIVFEPGVNVTEWSFTESTGPGEILSDVYVNGPPGSQQVTASDITTRGVYGRREAALSMFADAEDASITTGHLQDTADRAITGYVAPVIIPQIRLARNHQSIPWGSVGLGDIVTFRVRVASYDFINQPYRIAQISIELDPNNNETITLGLNAL